MLGRTLHAGRQARLHADVLLRRMAFTKISFTALRTVLSQPLTKCLCLPRCLALHTAAGKL